MTAPPPLPAVAPARAAIARALSRAIAPRKPLRVSEWAARHCVLSSKGSAIPGPWDNTRNPLLVEIMDCFSARSPVHEVVAMLPVQFGKSISETNILAYTMCENPQPVMVVLPSEVSMNKWVDQKLNPLIESTPAVARVLTSTNSRDASNRRAFKDFEGGQLYIEHAGNPVRLKSTSVGLMLVDEFASFANELKSGDDPDALLDGRVSAFPSTWKRLKVGTPEIEGICRISALYAQSDQRRWHWPCPDCGHEQPFEWGGLHVHDDGGQVWYTCRSCEATIEEHQKTELIARGRWIPANPASKIRGYHANCLYYPLGLGPRWRDLMQMWKAAQGDPARLKTFINDRLAEPWQDKSMHKANPRLLADRREPWRLRTAPRGVLTATAGVDTQDDRLAVHITGWGRGMVAWVLDYVELTGDPGEDAVWAQLTDLLNRPIQHETGGLIVVEATAIDAGGHRTEHVKNFVRQRRIRRPMCIFGARPNNAPILSRPKLQDVNYKGKLDKKGVHIYHVGTVAAKHWLYQRLAADDGRAVEERLFHLSDDLGNDYLDGLVSEVYNPRLGRFEKRRGGIRNEPLDCFDADTEVLTRNGWKRWPDVSAHDELATVHLPTDQIQYQCPLHLIDRPYDGDMVQLKGARIDILVTPNHRMVTLKKRHEPQPDGTRRWNFDVPPGITLAKDLTVHHAIKLNATWAGEARRTIHIPASVNCFGHDIEPARDVDAVDLAAFFGWWVSEGSVFQGRSRTQGNLRHRVEVTQIKPVSRQRLVAVLARLPWRFRTTGKAFVATSKQLYDLVLPAGRRQPERCVPQWIKDARPEVIAAFVDAAIDGDGWIQCRQAHHRASRAYATTSRRLADDMQELFIKLGRAATMRIVQPDGWTIQGRSGQRCLTQYHVCERLASRAYLDGGGNGQRGFFGKRVPYQGRVYCATVPNGTLILRRGGKTFIAGNCAVYSYAAAHHHGLRLHRASAADWNAREQRLLEQAREMAEAAPSETPSPVPTPPISPVPPRPPRRRLRSPGLR